jgi:hypothetical protein
VNTTRRPHCTEFQNSYPLAIGFVIEVRKGRPSFCRMRK